MKKKLGIKISLFLIIIIGISIGLLSNNLFIKSPRIGLNDKYFNLKASNSEYTNATVISDGNQGIIWNDDYSIVPSIALDNLGNVHVVWRDNTDGIWGTDTEIMYTSYSTMSGWSFPEVISDGFNDIYWNDHSSDYPDLAIDSSNNIHVVWADNTYGIWGTDQEIMYVCYTEATGWSNITVISDGYNNTYWNNAQSSFPSIAIDKNDKIHVVWTDHTDGIWGTDSEIMYVCYTISTGWSDVSIISDGYNGIYWNNGESTKPAIAIDNSNNPHVVWEDYTWGIWGTDTEIMYTSYSTMSGWSNASVISDGHNGIYWNDQFSLSPDIAVDSSNNVHVVWWDNTDGTWGTDTEIMYTEYSSASGWSLPVVIDDNSGACWDPCICIDPNDNVHVAWRDDTDGIWGTDQEIWYIYSTEGGGWSNSTVISDGYNDIYWNDDVSQRVSIVADTFKVHAVWEDFTDGVWGTDVEIMYTYISIPSAEKDKGIPYGNFYLILTILTILGLAVYIKKKSKL